MPTKLDSNKSEVNGLLDHLRDIEYSLKSPHNIERGRELLGAYQRITNRLRTIAPDKVPTRSGQLGPSSLAPVTQEPIQSAYGASSSISTPVGPNAALAAFQALPSSAPAPLPVPLQRSSNAATKNVGQTTPKVGQAAQAAQPVAAQPGGAPFPATPAERVSDTAAPLNPTPAQIESSPELAAFKAALEAPAPVFKGIGFTKAEQLALGFLAGLKGVESVAPIIAQRRAEAWQVYEAAKNAREDRLKGLYQVASISEEDRKSKAMMDATAAQREFSNKATLRQLDQGDRRLDLESKRVKLSANAAEMRGGPTSAARTANANFETAEQSATQALALWKLNKGFFTGGIGGFVAGRFTSRLIPGSTERNRLNNLLSDIGGAISQLRGGKNLTATELSIFGGAFPRITDDSALLESKLEHAAEFFTRARTNFQDQFGGAEAFGAPMANRPIIAPPPLPDGFSAAGDFELEAP